MNNLTKTIEGARCEGFAQGYAQAEDDIKSFLNKTAEAFGSRKELKMFLKLAFQDLHNQKL